MNIYILILLISAILFAIISIFTKKTPFFPDFSAGKYSKEQRVYSQRISACLTSIACLILATLIHFNLLLPTFFLLIPIIWGLLNALFLQISKKNQKTIE
ncbi:4-hydroxybenzoate polyprenyltransferase [Alkalibacillus salilacus]|uniref:4-hydroxybenzoate polyprenyltransferase n=1 Tax=Alkalibacillus salilacus TaxID=284582 RepID=A0ABT9VCX6_9BACI|nr:4-hydroxybenzoate polyprenyltransferase [Alkalibacillus salilacus]